MDRIEEYVRLINSKPTREKILLTTSLHLRGRIKNGDFLMVNFSSIMEELQYVFPDNWDIQFERTWETRRTTILKVEFVIRFPKFVITNSKEMTHTIHDLYVKLISVPSYLQSDGLSFEDFKGKRMTVTDEEILSKYQHSHQSSKAYTDIAKFFEDKKRSSYGQSITDSNYVFSYRGFCKGSSEINQILAMLRGKYTANMFKMFLLQLDLYVKWESIEGRPHIYMKYISGRAETNEPSQSNKKQFFSKLNLETPNLDFKIEKGKIKVVDNDNLEEFLKFKGNELADYPLFMHNFLCIKDEKGNYYSKRNLPKQFPEILLDTPENLARISWYFRGELVEFKILYQTEEQRALNANKPLFIHKSLKEYAKSRIEQTIKTQRFRCHISEQLSKINNITRSI